MEGNSKILIVEDEIITGESIAELLRQEDYQVVGICARAAQALDVCEETRPQVVICDIHLRGSINGLELARQIQRLYQCEIVFLTAYTDAQTIEQAAALNPVMFVVKPYTDMQLLVGVQMAFHRLFRKTKVPKPDRIQLSDREMEVVEFVAQGLSSKQVAQRMGISEETVKTHRKRMLQRNGISNFPQLIYMLQKHEGGL
jgi:DNA-binding NarL/FixJ family response regulator